MAAITTTRTFFNANSKVLQASFIKSVRQAPPIYPEIFNIYAPDMKRPFSTVLPFIGLGTFALKPEGAPVAFDQPGEGTPTTFQFATYGLGYKVTEEAELEDAENIISRMPGMLAFGERITKELLVWNVPILSFSSLAPIFDGLPLCSTAHPCQGTPGTTNSNYLGAVSLTPESFQQAQVLFQTWTDDRGMQIWRTPKWLMGPPQLQKQIEEIVGSPYYPYSDENRKNVAYMKAEPFINRYLTSTTAWWLVGDKGPIEGDTHSMGVMFKWQNRQRTWFEDASGNINHRSSFRIAFGVVDWRGIVGSQGA